MEGEDGVEVCMEEGWEGKYKRCHYRRGECRVIGVGVGDFALKVLAARGEGDARKRRVALATGR